MSERFKANIRPLEAPFVPSSVYEFVGDMGEFLRSIRELTTLSARQVAEITGNSITLQKIYSWENGNEPELQDFAYLVKAYEYLIPGSGEELIKRAGRYFPKNIRDDKIQYLRSAVDRVALNKRIIKDE